jgi:arylsulfatase A-like enzyme
MPLVQGDIIAAPEEFAYIDRIPWWEFNLSRWYLEFQRAKGANFPPSEKAGLDDYRAMLKSSFDKLDYPPGDIAIRTSEWKLILRKNKELLGTVSWWGFITGRKQDIEETVLYDLKNDPFEKKNVAKDKPEVVARLRAKLLAWDGSIEKQKAHYGKDEKRFIIPYP